MKAIPLSHVKEIVTLSDEEFVDRLSQLSHFPPQREKYLLLRTRIYSLQENYYNRAMQIFARKTWKLNTELATEHRRAKQKRSDKR